MACQGERGAPSSDEDRASGPHPSLRARRARGRSEGTVNAFKVVLGILVIVMGFAMATQGMPLGLIQIPFGVLYTWKAVSKLGAKGNG